MFDSEKVSGGGKKATSRENGLGVSGKCIDFCYDTFVDKR